LPFLKMSKLNLVCEVRQTGPSERMSVMASPMVAISSHTPIPRYPLSADAELKARSPYGLPLVEHCASCKLRNGNGFCSLAPDSLEQLDEIKHVTSYPEGALVFVEGQAARGVHIVCQGKVKLMTTNREGKTLIVKIAQAGEVLGLQSVMSGQPHEVTVETLQPAQLAFISREDFQRFIRTQGDACLNAAQSLGRDCQSAYELIRSIGLCHSVSEKLARFLLQWAEDGKMINGSLKAKLNLTHEEIAQLINASRETVTRTLSEFRKKGLLELSGSTLTILNKAAMERMAAK
jgi:CRP/FNR family transcriptional regulator, cyclic AMP receptor protein